MAPPPKQRQLPSQHEQQPKHERREGSNGRRRFLVLAAFGLAMTSSVHVGFLEHALFSQTSLSRLSPPSQILYGNDSVPLPREPDREGQSSKPSTESRRAAADRREQQKQPVHGDDEAAAHALALARNLSSVDYVACCGLGHRLSRMSGAYLVSKRLGLGLRAWWGYCYPSLDAANATQPQQQQQPPATAAAAAAAAQKPQQVEVFHYLFGPQPARELTKMLPLHRRRKASQSQGQNAPSTNTSTEEAGRGNSSSSDATDYSFGHYLEVINNVPGFALPTRREPPPRKPENPGGSSSVSSPPCPCTEELRDSNYEMYSGLRERFRFRSRVDRFRSRHFGRGGAEGDDRRRGSPTGGRPGRRPAVLGVHVRTGNGEAGDFVFKGRVVEDSEGWLASLARLLAAARPGEWGDAVVFVATDDPAVVPKLRSLLAREQQQYLRAGTAHHSNISGSSSSNSNSNSSGDGRNGTSRRRGMTVVSLDQARPEAGAGVLFGQGSRVLNRGGRCLDGWTSVVSDMILVSHADAVIAARPSSFTQAMPLSLVFGPPADSAAAPAPASLPDSSGDGDIPKEYCEVNRNATGMRCYRSFLDWCCNGSTRYTMGGMWQNYEFLSVPTTSESVPETLGGYKPRGAADPAEAASAAAAGDATWRPPGLPYDWAEA